MFLSLTKSIAKRDSRLSYTCNDCYTLGYSGFFPGLTDYARLPFEGEWMWDKIEVWARQIRDLFILLTLGVFIADNLSAFQDNQTLMYLFYIFGIIALASTSYISTMELTHINRRLKDTSIARERHFSHHKQGGGKIVMKWLRKHAGAVGVFVVLGAAIALYLIPSNLSKPWGVVLVALGPMAIWIARLIERKGRDNENLIRQLRPLVDDVEGLEFSIRDFARYLLSNSGVKEEIGIFGVQGWTNYIERLGDQQIIALSSLKKELKKLDPFEESHVQDALVVLYHILSRILEVEPRLSLNLCQKVTAIPAEAQSRWENIQQTHQRLGTQLGSLKPILSEKGRGDLFDTFVNQPPQNLMATI